MTYFLGLVTGNVSQIGESYQFVLNDMVADDVTEHLTDRQWTFLPIAYSLHFVLYPLFNNINGDEFTHNLPRLCLMWGLMVGHNGKTVVALHPLIYLSNPSSWSGVFG